MSSGSRAASVRINCSPRERCRSAYATIAYPRCVQGQSSRSASDGLHARAVSSNKSYLLSRLPRTIVTKVFTMVVDEPKLKARQIDERQADANMDFHGCRDRKAKNPGRGDEPQAQS